MKILLQTYVIILLFNFLILSSFGFAQERLHKVVYAEALGFASPFSVNFEFDFADSAIHNFFSYRLGISYPYIVFKNRNYVNIGASIGYNWMLSQQAFIETSIIKEVKFCIGKESIPSSVMRESFYPRGSSILSLALKSSLKKHPRIYIKPSVIVRILSFGFNSDYRWFDSEITPYVGIAGGIKF